MGNNKSKGNTVAALASLIAQIATKRYASAAANALTNTKAILSAIGLIFVIIIIIITLIVSLPGIIMQSILPTHILDNEKYFELTAFAGGEITTVETEKKNFITDFLDSLKYIVHHHDEETGESWTETFYAELVDPEPEKELVLILYSVLHEGYFDGAVIDQNKIKSITRSFLEPTGWMGLDVKVKPFEQVVSEYLESSKLTDIQSAIALNMYELYLFGLLDAEGILYDESYLDSTNVSGLGSGILICPVTSYKLTSSFGYRIHPITHQKKFHLGIDLAANTGSAIVAAESGTVTFSGYSGERGYLIIIDHGNGMVTKYQHCSVLLVKKDDIVSKGEQIAKVGSTGASTGPHLHFEVLINGTPKNPIDYM